MRWSILIWRHAIASQKTAKGQKGRTIHESHRHHAVDRWGFRHRLGVTHLLRPAFAAENITAHVIHTGELEGDALGPANAGGLRSKMFVSADGATVSVQDGNVPKHLHPNANEMQFILEGTGTIWLGEKEG